MILKFDLKLKLLSVFFTTRILNSIPFQFDGGTTSSNDAPNFKFKDETVQIVLRKSPLNLTIILNRKKNESVNDIFYLSKYDWHILVISVSSFTRPQQRRYS